MNEVLNSTDKWLKGETMPQVEVSISDETIVKLAVAIVIIVLLGVSFSKLLK